jgi:hypothetical protein|tara:strand:- start:933 stop:1133 length:201 start_codon:yes stop_codon:yes gene_type:complete
MERVYLKFMEYVIKLIDEIGNALTDNKMDENLIKKLSVIILNPKYRIQLGVLIILISFIIYIVSVL